MALCLMPFLPPNQQRRSTEGIKLPDVQCTENWLTCKNYIANYKIFQEHQLNSRKFQTPGVVDTMIGLQCSDAVGWAAGRASGL